MQSHDSAFTRRLFLQRGVTLASAAATIPWFLQNSGMALAQMTAQTSSIPGVPDERVLVVIQLAGGNDGLNTVIPYGDPEYHRARAGIGVKEHEALGLDRARGLGLHPALNGVRNLYDDGLVSVVQGVGYPNPNRSHFMSMDIWHTAETSGTGTGWLGRYFDNCCQGAPDPAKGVAIGRSAPRAMQGRSFAPVSFESPEFFQWAGKELHESLAAGYDGITRHGVTQGVPKESNAAFLMRTALDAQVSGEQIRKAAASEPMAQYPRSALASQLRLIAGMIRSGMKTRVYYASMSGFDTHAGQGGAQGQHANLLGQYGDALRAFYADLKAQGAAERVLTMTFSEFGRRVSQNASGGTDHGAAAPMFLAGPMVRAGVLGEHPSLIDLDDGDLKYGVDFRSVYAGVLEEWLKVDAEPVLGRGFRAAKILKTGA